MKADPPRLPALVVGEVTHQRLTPVGHRLRHRHYHWLVDLDDLPRHRGLLGLLSTFRAADHLDGGRQGGGIRGDVERFLAHRGIDVEPGDRLLMLAHPRMLGHGFNPLSVHWLVRPDEEVRAVVLEVHNTYGERHAYLLQLDDAGRAEVDKDFFVSPFNDVSGSYAVQTVLTPRSVRVSVRLDRDDAPVLVASVTGTPEPATRRNILRLALTHPLMTQRVTVLIRLHGIWLWARRLPVRARPSHDAAAVR